jgi:hypothetical protein
MPSSYLTFSNVFHV